MNICIINVDHSPQYVGGIKRVSAVLAKQWLRLGEHMVVFLSLCTSSQKFTDIWGIPQYFFPNGEEAVCESNLQFFLNFVKTHQIDIVYNPHLEDRGITELCFHVRKLSSVKLVSGWHFAITHFSDILGQSFYKRLELNVSFSTRLKRWLQFIAYNVYKKRCLRAEQGERFRVIYEHSDALVLLSERLKKIFFSITRIKSDSRLFYINNPSVEDAFTEPSSKEKCVVWCGRVEYGTKRTDRMLEVWSVVSKLHPDWKLLILGSGDIDYWKKLARHYQIDNIEYMGFCDPFPFFNTSSIICSTSVTEGWGMTLVEAMQTGCVPIAYGSYPSLHDIIRNEENGFIVKPYDKVQYINRLSELMQNNHLREQMSRRARKTVQRFSSDKIASQWLALFQKLLGE